MRVVGDDIHLSLSRYDHFERTDAEDGQRGRPGDRARARS
jgi:hypothetical protein